MSRIVRQLGLFFATALFAAALIATAQAKDRVKVGFIGPLTGGVSVNGIGGRNSAELAVKLRNADAKATYEYELIVLDDECKPNVAVQVATKMAADKEIIAGATHYCSATAIATVDIYHKFGFPIIVWGAVLPDITYRNKYAEVHRVNGTMIDQNDVNAELISKLGFKTVAVIHDTTDYGKGHNAYFSKSFTKLGGKITAVQSYQEGDQDFNAQLTSLKGGNPEVIFVPGYYNDVGLIAKQARDRGITVPLVGGDGWDSVQLYAIGGKALNGSYFTNHYSPYDTDPKVQKFVNDYKSRYGNVPDALAATAYDAARIMFDAIKRSKSLGGNDIREALVATKDFPGVTGTVTFNENRDAVKPIVMIEIKDGGTYAVRERVTVEGATTAAAPAGAAPAAAKTASQ